MSYAGLGSPERDRRPSCRPVMSSRSPDRHAAAIRRIQPPMLAKLIQWLPMNSRDDLSNLLNSHALVDHTGAFDHGAAEGGD
jgi:hypothetical protein